MNRFELRAIAILGLVLALGGGLFAARLLAFGIPDACLGVDEFEPVCAPWTLSVSSYHEFTQTGMGIIIFGLGLLPIVGGLLIGTSLVAKEIDQGTATFAWSVGPDRRRWLLLRAAPTALLLVVVALAIGLFDDWLIWLAQRQPVAGLGFELMAFRGVVPAGAALSVLGISMFVGAVMGRILPTLLIAGGFVVCAYLGASFLGERFLENETIVVESVVAPPGRTVEGFFETPEGERISWDEAFNRYGWDQSQWTVTLKELVRLNVYETYPLVAARMALLHGALGFSAITLAFAVVARRRP